MENSIKKERRESSCFSFGLEKRGQPVPFPADLQEGKILKAHANLSKDAGIVKINVILLITLFAMIYISMAFNLNSVDILYPFIQYLALLALILYNRTTVLLTPGKIIIHRHLFRSLVLRKEDIAQTSVYKNKGNSLRWLLRLLVLAALAIQLPHTLESITRDLQMETAPAFVILTSVIVDLWTIAYILVIFYIFEIAVPYQQVLKITTYSKLNFEFYTEEPEKIMATFKNKNE